MHKPVQDLTARQLAWAVAKASCQLDKDRRLTGDTLLTGWWLWGPRQQYWIPLQEFDPCQNWGDAGPLIDQEGILVGRSNGRLWKGDPGAFTHAGQVLGGREHGMRWVASLQPYEDLQAPMHFVFGPGPMWAAMRCLVRSKFGDVVDIPDEFASGESILAR